MIDPALLTRLRKTDTETWHKFDARIVGSATCHDGSNFVDVDICRIRLDEPVQEAWLQHVLQDAIRAKGWQFKLQSVKINGNPGYEAVIWFVRGERRDIGNSPAEALLLAYLAAIECV